MLDHSAVVNAPVATNRFTTISFADPLELSLLQEWSPAFPIIQPVSAGAV